MISEKSVSSFEYKDAHLQIIKFIKEAVPKIKKDGGTIISISHSISASEESGSWYGGSVIIYWEKEIDPQEYANSLEKYVD